MFEEYRAQLAEHGLKEVDDTYRDAAALLREGGAGSGYAAVVVDEAQDMGAQAFSLIRAIAAPGPNDLFIAGDGHQRIYGRNRVVPGRCGIDIRFIAVYTTHMTRTNIDIDDEACVEVMRRYRLSTKREAVNFALRLVAAEPLGLDEARGLRGSGWDGDLDEMRSGRAG